LPRNGCIITEIGGENKFLARRGSWGGAIAVLTLVDFVVNPLDMFSARKEKSVNREFDGRNGENTAMMKPARYCGELATKQSRQKAW